MEQRQIEITIIKVINALKSAGYEPFKQLESYIKTGDCNFITRRDNARTLIVELDINEVERYLRKQKLII